MKLKQLPDDFQVEEVTQVVPGMRGAFAFYRLEKQGWTTPDALALVRRRWKIEPRRLSYGGLKDRHAATVQYLTIFHGPRRNLAQQHIQVTYLGQIETPYSSRDMQCNRFRLTLRDLSEGACHHARKRLETIATDGVPNYFDDQRFGSVEGEGSEFIARLMVRGKFEDALKLALAAPYEFDRVETKREKELLLAQWGDWAGLKEKLPRGHARSLVDYLRVHPTDFKGAVARLRPELRTLYLSAYQSHLWNRMLARWLKTNCREEQLRSVSLRMGEVPFPVGLDAGQRESLRKLFLPLPTARLRLDPADPLLELVNGVLAEDGLTYRDLQIRGIREIFFSKGERAALCIPGGLQSEFGDDDIHPGRQQVVLSFDLPRGAYATLIVKAITS